MRRFGFALSGGARSPRPGTQPSEARTVPGRFLSALDAGAPVRTKKGAAEWMRLRETSGLRKEKNRSCDLPDVLLIGPHDQEPVLVTVDAYGLRITDHQRGRVLGIFLVF